MSRFCGEKEIEPILGAAKHWVRNALQKRRSVFSAAAVWTDEALESLQQHFVQQPDEGGEKFLEKLEKQLENAIPTARKLAAEMLWLMYLCPSSLTPSRKRQTVSTVWSWSGEDLDLGSPWLAESILSGIGSAGPGFNRNQWRELVFCIELTARFQSLVLEEQNSLLDDGWHFDQWLTSVPGWESRQLRHMLLFMLFPNDFERIFGQHDRKEIARSFSELPSKQINKMNPLELDRELRAIRARLEEERQTHELDYYVQPLCNEWPSKAGQMVESGDGEMQLEKLIENFVQQAAAGTSLSAQNYTRSYRDLKVRVSFGKGNFARIPWVAFLRDGEQVSRGIYPVLLLFKETNSLVLCYGISEEQVSPNSWGPLPTSRTVQDWYQARFNRNPGRYGKSIVHSTYDLSENLSVADLKSALDEVINLYSQLSLEGSEENLTNVRLTSTAGLETRANMLESAAAFAIALRDANVTFGVQHDQLVAAFLASIVSKPLVILTGLSGSGKTQLALRLGEWLGTDRLHVAAVRPDWTGGEAIFGYEDALKPPVGGLAAWHVPLPLAFMLKAAEDPHHPHLLVLDEMNLAHVERYFADVLSGMESGQACLPNLQKGQDGLWRVKHNAVDRIPFPPNVWVVGTVNVDETTYMFSPKVLDRANTFEFRVSTEELSPNALKPIPCKAGDPALVRGLLQISNDKDWHVNHASTYCQQVADALRSLHKILSQYGREFGHRVFYDSIRFATVVEQAGIDEYGAILDRIIMQKILPKVHGSRRSTETLLLALARYCSDPTKEQEAYGVTPSSEEFANPQPRLPISYSKIGRMVRSVRENQFVSFTE